MSEPLWAAIDAITKPTTMRLWRGEELSEVAADYANRKVGLCDVSAYRASVTGHGVIPSLWEQAEQALYKTGETQDGNRSPLATRSPADVQLMETMLTLRELVAKFYADHGQDHAGIPTTAQLPAELRHMASEIIRRNADITFWGYRIEQLRRLLENHLQAIDRGPKPMRPRFRCPTCKTEHITIPDPDGNLDRHGKPQNILVRPILAVYRDGHLRCLECEACSDVWFGIGGPQRLQAEHEADEEPQRPTEELTA